MKNSEIAKVFADIGDLLELKEENIFKIRAYQKAARTIGHLSVDAEKLLKEKILREVPGIGETIAKKMEELVTTGHLKYYEELKSEFPEGISTLLEVPGIGPRTALLLSGELGICSTEELETAIISGKVSNLHRMGSKTAENILHHLQSLRRNDQRIPLGEALSVVEEISDQLSKTPGLKNLMPTGSLRRFLETVGDIDLIATADDADKAIQAFTSMPQVKEILTTGTTKASVMASGELRVNLRIVDHDSFGSALQYFTGSKQHNTHLREKGNKKGLRLFEHGIIDLKTNKLEKFASEEAFYRKLELPLIPPELREGGDEIDRAERDTLPKLIEISDIKGDFHVHSNWSDGRDSIKAMALAAKELGHQYIAISDHSAGRGIANGLDTERLKKQISEIKGLNTELSGIRILTGIEVDIRADGNLDMPNEVLAELDIVTAAVHSGMGGSQEKMTRRIIKAMENPNVDILAHPTCRLLLSREPIAVDMEAIFKTATKTNTMLEINSMPSRLDLKDIHIQRARELGVNLVINTDAHATEHLEFVRFGIGTARRGWCKAKDITNTKPFKEVISFLYS